MNKDKIRFTRVNEDDKSNKIGYQKSAKMKRDINLYLPFYVMVIYKGSSAATREQMCGYPD